jgi:hypothetical protein
MVRLIFLTRVESLTEHDEDVDGEENDCDAKGYFTP